MRSGRQTGRQANTLRHKHESVAKRKAQADTSHMAITAYVLSTLSPVQLHMAGVFPDMLWHSSTVTMQEFRARIMTRHTRRGSMPSLNDQKFLRQDSCVNNYFSLKAEKYKPRQCVCVNSRESAVPASE